MKRRLVMARAGDGPTRVCVMVSGGGSNLRALHAAAERGNLGGGEIVVVVSDKPGCGGWKFAEEKSIATVDFTAIEGRALAETLAETHGVDLVLLAGFLKLIPAPFCERYERAMLNIHPALLPAFGGKGFYGERVHQAVIASGARISGATVHFVTSEYDRGPILDQRAVRVLPTDTASSLAARVLQAEHELYAEAAGALCAGRVLWREDGVPYYHPVEVDKSNLHR